MTLTDNSSFNKKQIIIFLLILFLGGALRLYGLNKQSFWYDELRSLEHSEKEDISSVIAIISEVEIHPPGYYIFLHYITKFFGNSEIIVRLPSAIFGIIAIFIIFLLGRKLYSYKEGLIASFLMASLYQPIYYSQEARPYTMLLLFTMLSVYFYIDIFTNFWHGKQTTYYLIIGYILSAIFSCYVHYFGVYFICIQFLILFLFSIRKPKNILTTLLIYLVILIAYLPSLPRFLDILKFTTIYSKLLRSSLEQSYLSVGSKGIVTLFNQLTIAAFNNSKTFAVFVLVLCLSLLVKTFYIFLRSKSLGKHTKDINCLIFFILLWVVLPFLGAYLISLFWVPVFSERNLIIILPALYIFFSRSIVSLFLNIKIQTIIIIITASLIAGTFNIDYYRKPFKEQFREAGEFVAKNSYSYDDLSIIAWGCSPRFFDYYIEKFGLNKKIDLMIPARYDVNILQKFITERNPRYLWFLCYEGPDSNYIPQLIKEFKKCAIITKKKSFIGINLWFFRRQNEDWTKFLSYKSD
jgi:4-amino-4-deoxy-L-arabinose transferase-like glycosyltransferase